MLRLFRFVRFWLVWWCVVILSCRVYGYWLLICVSRLLWSRFWWLINFVVLFRVWFCWMCFVLRRCVWLVCRFVLLRLRLV